jgi:hypothetical protein
LSDQATTADERAKAGLGEVTVTSDEFFRRARELFTFDVPPGLTDPNIIPPTDDEGMRSVLKIVAE